MIAFSGEVPFTGGVCKESVRVCTPESPASADDSPLDLAALQVFPHRARAETQHVRCFAQREQAISDGTVLGTFGVGTGPWGVAFDGANIWVTNGGSNNVTKLRASDGMLLGTFNAGAAPVGVAFDGANIWVTSFDGNIVSKL